MANGGLRINQKVNKRHGTGHLARKEAKREDRATFRQQAQQGFDSLSHGVRVIDYAVVGVYTALVDFRAAQLALDIALVLAMLVVTAVLATYVVVAVGVIAYTVLLAHLYTLRRRTNAAKAAAAEASQQRQAVQA